MKRITIIMIVLFLALIAGISFGEDINGCLNNINDESNITETNTGTYLTIVEICHYEIEPKEDIIAYELALIFSGEDPNYKDFDELPEGIRRHYRRVCY